jgi:two-component system LytT family sensor kinase
MWSWNHFSGFDLVKWIAKLDRAVGVSSIFFSISFTWRLLETWVLSLGEKLALEKDLKDTEYEFLKSQINPHFLFNVLGCINGLAMVKSDKTTGAIKNLKGLIGSAILMKTGEKVSLKDELSFLRSFINLHEIRYTVPIELSFAEARHYEVEPMLFLPFIENAFKHGDLSETGLIKISCIVVDGILEFSVENNLIKNVEIGSGIGDENVKKRLDYVYPDKHDLTVTISSQTYNVNLKISLENE